MFNPVVTKLKHEHAFEIQRLKFDIERLKYRLENANADTQKWNEARIAEGKAIHEKLCYEWMQKRSEAQRDSMQRFQESSLKQLIELVGKILPPQSQR